MTKEELLELLQDLHPEDKNGKLTGVCYDRYGGSYTTDSLRLDMDGGRIILVQEGSEIYQTNKNNAKVELQFVRKKNGKDKTVN